MNDPINPSPLTVLIIEDEAMIALMLEDSISVLGHRVCAIATTLAEAQRHVANGGFDLAIVDCHLKGEDAWPAVDMLASLGIPFVLSSGGSLADMPAAHARRPLLSKPYSIAAISDALEACERARG